MDFFDYYPHDPYSYRGQQDDGYDNSHSYYVQPPMASREQPYPPYPHPRPPYPPKPDYPCPPKPYPPKPVCPDVKDDYYTYPQNLVPALELIAMVVAGECYDELFYDAMIKMAHTQGDKDLIKGMRDDMKKHMELLRLIYCLLAGEKLPKCKEPKFDKPKTYCDGIQKAFMSKIEKVEKYRKILYAMRERRHINMLIEIITDTQIHIDKWDHLYAMNECFEQCRDDRKKMPR